MSSLFARADWDRLVSHQNEAAVVDVLWNALAGMLKEREGPVSREAQASHTPPDPNNETGREGGEEEGGTERTIVPEDRSAAAELLRKGEQRVLQKCLHWVEVRRHFCLGILRLDCHRESAKARGVDKEVFPPIFWEPPNASGPPAICVRSANRQPMTDSAGPAASRCWAWQTL